MADIKVASNRQVGPGSVGDKRLLETTTDSSFVISPEELDEILEKQRGSNADVLKAEASSGAQEQNVSEVDEQSSDGELPESVVDDDDEYHPGLVSPTSAVQFEMSNVNEGELDGLDSDKSAEATSRATFAGEDTESTTGDKQSQILPPGVIIPQFSFVPSSLVLKEGNAETFNVLLELGLDPNEEIVLDKAMQNDSRIPSLRLKDLFGDALLAIIRANELAKEEANPDEPKVSTQLKTKAERLAEASREIDLTARKEIQRLKGEIILTASRLGASPDLDQHRRALRKHIDDINSQFNDLLPLGKRILANVINNPLAKKLGIPQEVRGKALARGLAASIGLITLLELFAGASTQVSELSQAASSTKHTPETQKPTRIIEDDRDPGLKSLSTAPAAVKPEEVKPPKPDAEIVLAKAETQKERPIPKIEIDPHYPYRTEYKGNDPRLNITPELLTSGVKSTEAILRAILKNIPDINLSTNTPIKIGYIDFSQYIQEDDSSFRLGPQIDDEFAMRQVDEICDAFKVKNKAAIAIQFSSAIEQSPTAIVTRDEDGKIIIFFDLRRDGKVPRLFQAADTWVGLGLAEQLAKEQRKGSVASYEDLSRKVFARFKEHQARIFAGFNQDLQNKINQGL